MGPCFPTKNNIKYAHGFVLFGYVIHIMYLPISFRVTSLALGQSYDCPSGSKVTLKDMGKSDSIKTQQSINHVDNSWDVL